MDKKERQELFPGKDTRTKHAVVTGDGGGGIQSMNQSHNKDGSMSVGSSLTTQGLAGWSKSPSGKEFDLPQDSNKKICIKKIKKLYKNPKPSGVLTKSN